MGALHATEVLDRTPVLFRSRGNLRHVSQDSVGVGAVLAVDLLDQVQVLEMVPVKGQILPSPHIRDAVDRKAQPLIETANQVQQGDRDETGVNDRRGDQDQEAGTQHIPV